MPTLEECKKKVGRLVQAKKFYSERKHIPMKILFAFIELGEAGNAWKKRMPEESVAEELIDVIFYVLDAWRLACPNLNPDEVFDSKWRKNMSRPMMYGEGYRSLDDEKDHIKSN